MMPVLVAAALVSAGALAAGAQPARIEKPKLVYGAIANTEKLIEKRLDHLFAVDDPFSLLVVPRGVYLENYGVVFTAEVNLLTTAGISPFHQEMTRQEIDGVRRRKSERLPPIRDALRGILIEIAAGLDPVPANEQVVLGVTLFYAHWEDTSGLPAQIVMQASRGTLLELKQGRGDRKSIQVREF